MINVLLSRFKDCPALVAPEMAMRVEASLEAAANVLLRISSAADSPTMDDDFWYDPNDWRAAYRPYVVKDGVLQIPVKGVLLHDMPYTIGDYATGYPYIARAYQRGMDDSQVKGIALVVDSPGGEVAGNFDLVDKMFARRDEKPVRAYAAECMYSAAYSIGSVASRIIVSRTGGVGSIGVVTGHVDVSGAMDKAGIKVTFIHFGKHKVDGNPYEPLPADVQARIQARIDELGEVFVATVARNRGMNATAVRETEALTYTATQGVANGLADEIGSLEDSLVAFRADMNEEDETMVTQVDVDNAKAAGVVEGRAAAATENAAAVDTARKDGATTERTRTKAILGSDAAKTRPGLASHLVFNTGMSAEDAITTLAASAEEKPVAAVETGKPAPEGNAFAKHMNTIDHPNVGAEAGSGEGGDKPDRADNAFALLGKPRQKAA